MNRSEYAANRGLATAARATTVTAYVPAARPDITRARAAVAASRAARRPAPVAAVVSFAATLVTLAGFGGAQ